MVMFEFARAGGNPLNRRWWTLRPADSRLLAADLQESGGDGRRRNGQTTSTIVNGVHGKCGVVNSLTKFFDDCTGSPFFARSWPASSVTRSKFGL